MIGEVLSLIAFTGGIVAFLVRLGFFRRLLQPLLCQKILDEEKSLLKASARNLTSTFDSSSSTTP